MKINEVPQDEAFLIEGKIRDVCYAVDDKGKYTRVLSKGWTPKNNAIRLAWNMIYDNAEDIRQQVLSGNLSPIAFYMVVNIMDASILAGYMGLSRWRVKRHMHMKKFLRLKPELINAYAGVFDLGPGELLDLEKIRAYHLEHED
jgi:hypothetical protein